MTRFGVEQHGCNFAPARAFLFAIEGTDEECQAGTLRRRQLQAAEPRASSFAGKAPMQAPKAVQPCAEIVIEWKQERVAACMNVFNEPDPMTALRTLKKDMAPVLRVSVLNDRR